LFASGHVLKKMLLKHTMNRSSTPNARPVFASKTAFEGLPVDSGEDSEDEQLPDPSSAAGEL
jgi:hypothetical protein